jgi:hypothetical protein
MVTAATKLAIMKEKRIPNAPRPIESKINAVKNLATVETISKTNTLFAFEIPSNAKRPTKLIAGRTSNAMDTHMY